MSLSSVPLWLIGTGPMAQAYAAVLKAQDVPFIVIGRSQANSEAFSQVTGLPVIHGGLEIALNVCPVPKIAIVAVGIDQLYLVTRQLISAGCEQLLLEKPGSLYISELKAIEDSALASGTQVWIAYNRRFYSSVKRLRELVIEDGGILSSVFEFTEWSHRIGLASRANGIKQRWLLANSSHVLDLAFALIGLPAEGHWQAWQRGSIDWHPVSARFHGAGLSQHGVPFSYNADWESPGRWGLEILTRRNRFILRPLEKLQAVPLGSLDPEVIDLPDTDDRDFKPGLYQQCKAFLTGDTQYLCSLSYQLKAFPVYARIAGYSP